VTFFIRTIPQQHAAIKTLFDAIGQQEAEDAVKMVALQSTPQAKRFKKSTARDPLAVLFTDVPSLSLRSVA